MHAARLAIQTRRPYVRASSSEVEDLARALRYRINDALKAHQRDLESAKMLTHLDITMAQKSVGEFSLKIKLAFLDDLTQEIKLRSMTEYDLSE